MNCRVNWNSWRRRPFVTISFMLLRWLPTFRQYPVVSVCVILKL